ncbi:MAG: PilW family protein [Thermoleophilia bacterium]
MKLIRKINQRQRLAGSEGFTLVEMLVSMLILSVVMSAIFAFLWSASSYWQAGQATADVTENARLGLNRMTRELKQASQITSATTTEIVFKVNYGNGVETVSYGFKPGNNGNPGIIWRNSDQSTQMTLMENVKSAQFAYYGNDYRCDSNFDGEITYSGLQSCSGSPNDKIVRVDITLTMKSGNHPDANFVGQAWLRNQGTI